MATRKIGTEIVLSGETQFNDAMRGVNNNLKNLRTDMAAVSSEFDDNGNSMEALTKKQKILEESVDQHKAKVDALSRMYEEQKSKYGENSAAADKYRQQLNQATVALNKETAALEKNADALEEANTAAIRAAAEKAKKILGGVGTAAAGIGKGIGVVSLAAAAGVAAIGAGGVIALTQMAGMAREAAEAAKAAQEAGETLTETQQQWLEYSGQLDALDASVSGAKAALSSILLPVLRDLSTDGAAFLNDFSRDMNAAAGNTGAQTQVLTDYIVKGVGLIKEKLPEYIAAGKELFSGLGDGLSEAGPEILDMGTDVVMDLLDGILNAAPQLAQAGISLIQEHLLPGLIAQGPDALKSGVGMVTQIVSGLAKAAPQLVPMAATLVSTLLISLLESSPQLLVAGLELVFGIISGISSGLGDILASADEIIVALIMAFVEAGAEFLGIGSDAVEKIRSGLTSGLGNISEFGSDVVEYIKTGITNAWSSFAAWFENLWNSLFGNRSVNVDVSGSGSGGGKPNLPGLDGTHASGLNYVPFDGYLAMLHRGEMVLTSAEAAMYRRGGSQSKTVNLYFYAKSITESEIQMIVDVVNRKLGDDL